MAQDRQDTLLSLIAGQICPTVKSAVERTDPSGRTYNLLQAIRTPSYTAKPPRPPKTVVPNVQYGLPKAVTPGSDSTKPTTSSGSETPNPVKIAQQSKEWDAAMTALRTGRRTPVQPRGLSGPVYPTAPKVAPSSGDSHYDNLQSTKDRLSQEAIERRKQEVFRKSDIPQEMTTEQLQKEMKGFKTWGSSAPSWLRNAVAKGHKWVGNAVDFYSGRKMNGQQFAEEAANDTLNNWQGMWEGAKRSGGNAIRSLTSLGSHVVPGGSSYRMQKFRQGLANATANADALYDAKRDVLENSNQTELDAHTTLGTVNNATRNFFGNIAGETAAMGAVGGAAGVGAKAIRGVAGVTGRVAGNTVTKALTPAMEKMRYMQSGFGRTAKNLAAAEGRAGMAPTAAARNAYAKTMTSGGVRDRVMMMQRAGKPVNMQSPHFGANFEERLGGAVDGSFRMVGDVMAKPLQLTADAVSGFGNNMGGAVRGVGRAVFHPIRTAGRIARAPGNAVRSATRSVQDFGRNFAMHPWQSTGHGLWNAGKFVINPKTMAYAQMPGVYGDMFTGNFGDAARGMGTMGATKFMWTAPGAVQAPLFIHDAGRLMGGSR